MIANIWGTGIVGKQYEQGELKALRS